VTEPLSTDGDLLSEKSNTPKKKPNKPQRRIHVRYRYRVLLRREITPFAWPIFMELTCVVLMSMLSTILVSRIGKADTAAVGVTDSITFIVISIFSAIELGGSVFIAQSYARRDYHTSLKGAVHAIHLNIIVSVILWLFINGFTVPLLSIVAYGAPPDVIQLADLYLQAIALSYPALAIAFAGSGVLRAIGNSRLPAIANILMNLFNIVFSYPLIYGWADFGFGAWEGLGLWGAGIGITLARWGGALMILIALIKNQTFRIPLPAFIMRIDQSVLKEILSIGIPASVESLMFNIGKLLTQIMVAGMGTVAMAGNYIAFSIVLLLNIPGNTLSMASTVLIGRRLGQDKPGVARQEIRLIYWSATLCMMGLALVSVPFANLIAHGYSHDPEVVDVVVNLVYLNALMSPIWAASFVLPSAFKGAKDVKYSMWTAIFSMWGCRVVLGYLLGIQWGLGVYGVWLGMFADWWFRGGLYFYRMLNNHWLIKYFRQQHIHHDS
jgi:putative MATE family efflux protein